MPPGIHLLHKPPGATSFSLVQQAVEQFKKESNRRARMCHGGALDPFAQGLLLILAGPATRLFDYLHDIPKTYLATIAWGTQTDNADPTGKVISTGDASSLTPDRLDEALATFVGWHEQVPPSHSNKRIAGERAYVKAHRGETVELPPVRVYLHSARWIEHDLPRSSRIELVTRGGYYVRALARDLGQTLGCGAHLAALQRTAIGPWQDPGEGNQIAITGRDLLPWLPSRDLAADELHASPDQPLQRGDLHPPQWNLPHGFPPTAPLVRGYFRDRLWRLFREEDGVLKHVLQLTSGI